MGEGTVCYKPFFGLLHTVGEGESTIVANNTNEIKLKSVTRKMYEMYRCAIKLAGYRQSFSSNLTLTNIKSDIR